MAFMMKKKRYKFTVHLSVDDLTAVPFVNAVLFVKVRLLDGGNFNETSSREEVKDHIVKWEARFEFVCKMSANASTGVLDPCILRISVRKELKGGRSFQKLGFTDLNLAEFAGCGETTRRCLLEGYDTRHRQDNSMLRISIQMNMLSGDVLFKVPSPSLKQKPISKQSPEENETAIGAAASGGVVPSSERSSREDFSGGSVTSTFGSLPKKRPALFDKVNSEPSSFVSSDAGDCLGLTETDEQPDDLANSTKSCCSSNISQNNISKNSHSRQSSSSESGHISSSLRLTKHQHHPKCPTSPMIAAAMIISTATPTKSTMMMTPSPTCYSSLQYTQVNKNSPTAGVSAFRFPPWSGPSPRAASSPGLIPSAPDSPTQRTLSGSSCLSETGSLDRGKSALERRKKAEENATSGRVEITRVNPDNLIEQLIKSTNFEQSDDMTSSSGLQLFISKDGGTTALGGQDVKHQISTGVFKQVVMEEHR